MLDHAPLLERAFQFHQHEDSYEVTGVEGTIPEYVRGTYFLNGPARFARGDFRYRHWLDGDGMVCALRIAPHSIRFTNRFVRGTKLETEEAVRRPVFRAFGTAFPGDRLKRGIATESPLNVSVYPFRGKLLAFGEQALPQELDPVTLRTRGPFDFDGQLNEISPFAAHPKFDAVSGEMVNFGVSFSSSEPCLNLYRFRATGELVYRRRVPLPYPCSLHDFGLSPRYAIFHVSPYLLNLDRLRREGRTTMDSLTWEPERGSQLLVIARETGEPQAIVPVGRGYCLHQINAFEEPGRLTVDLIEYERPIYDQYQIVPDLFTDVPAGGPVRLVIDSLRGALLERSEMAYRMAPDFPVVDPSVAGRPYRDFWALGISATGRPGRKFFDQLVHARWPDGDTRDLYRAPPVHYLAGEPAFVGNPDEPSEGIVICPLFDAGRQASYFAIFDAFAVARGPLATLRLKAPIHPGFHAAFLAGGGRQSATSE